ncbi:MAG: phosphohistidine phosphatase SixA [Betaproteobacteria bacterium RBG_16_58_11]|nr:MAG: phosphohistidine phosphatase SixA [Betaproteobacteria bacterium RBG_16_58_11]
MDLILWRHAEAEDGMPDAGRKLTEKGLKQAQQMAAWLKPRLPQNTRILVSPATRTQQTAAALGMEFETVKEVGTAANTVSLLAKAGWPDTHGAVLVVGHQPTLGQVAAFLLSGAEQDWSIKKGAVWWISNRVRQGEGQTVLRCVMAPDML